jgi:hypothetical protein
MDKNQHALGKYVTVFWGLHILFAFKILKKKKHMKQGSSQVL